MRRSPRAEDDPLELDGRTLERARRGDRAAFRQLLERYQRPVFALLSRILMRAGQEGLVEDLAQETFVRVYRNLASFGQDGRLHFSSWVLTIAARLAIDELRRRTPRIDSLDARVHQVASSERADDDLERRCLASAIVRAVEQLAPEYRAAFLLREVHGLEYEAIAESLNIDIGTVKSRLFRARTALRAALSGIYDET